MTVKYAVSFEHDTQPVVTIRGEATGTSFASLFARAARAAKKQAGNKRWRSAVCVIEKLEED